METLIGLPFKILEMPRMRLKKPSFLTLPSAMTVFSLILLSYFLVLGGVIYDIIIEPPSIGQVRISLRLLNRNRDFLSFSNKLLDFRGKIYRNLGIIHYPPLFPGNRREGKPEASRFPRL